MKSTGAILIIYKFLIHSSEYEEYRYHNDNLQVSDTQ